MEARAPDSVAEHLQAQGFMPIQIEEATAGQWRGLAGRIPTRAVEPGRNRHDDARDIHAAACRPAARPCPWKSWSIFRPTMRSPKSSARFVRTCAGGASLYAALDAQQGVFSRFYLNMIRAGEAGGALEVVMLRLTEFMERAKDLREPSNPR